MAATQNTVIGTIALEDESKAAMDRLSDSLDRFALPEVKAQDVPPTVPQIIEWEPRTRPPRVIAQCPACGVHVDSIAETFEIVLSDEGSGAPTRVFGRLRHDHEDGSVTTWPYIADEPKPDVTVEIEIDVPEIVESEQEAVEEGQQRDRDEPFEFTRDHDGSLSLSAAVHEALGAASVCWESMTGTGVFDSNRATEIGAALLREIERKTRLKNADEVREGDGARAAAWSKVVTHKAMHQLDQREGEAYSDAVLRRLDRAVEDAERVRYYAPRLQMTRSAIAQAHDRVQGIGIDGEPFPSDTRRLFAAGAILRDVMDREARTTQPSEIEVGGQWMTQQQFDAASAAGRAEAERLSRIIERARLRLRRIMETRASAGSPEDIATILEGADAKGGE